MADQQDRNLPASHRRIAKAREDGQVARSRDLAPSAADGRRRGGAGGAGADAPRTRRGQLLSAGLRFDASALATPQAMLQTLSQQAQRLLVVLLPLGVGDGGGWPWRRRWCRAAGTSPGSRWRRSFASSTRCRASARMFSKQQLGDTLKASAARAGARRDRRRLSGRSLARFHDALAMPLPAALSHTGAVACCGGVRLLLLPLAAFAAVDVPLQRHLCAQAAEDEPPGGEAGAEGARGQPRGQGQGPARMREMANRRMLAAVPQADLVVMNPTHYAVALKYDDATMAAPRVRRQGRRPAGAAHPRHRATTPRCRCCEAPPLARALYAHAEIDREMPAALFAAVAQVLAYVYQLRAALSGKAPMPRRAARRSTCRPSSIRTRPPDAARTPTNERADAADCRPGSARTPRRSAR